MIDFEALEKAFAPIQEVGRQEIPFEVEGQRVVLQPLLPSDETAAQGYAREWVDAHSNEEGEVPKHIATEYMNVLRTEVLCYALVEVNGLDLRGVDYVATGQKTDSNKAVRVQKHVAVRNLITKKMPWSRTMLEAAFDKFGELSERIETAAADIVKYVPADLTTEYELAKKRVTDLEEEMEKRAKGDPNLFADQLKSIREYDTANKVARQEARAPTPEAEVEPEHESTSGRAPGGGPVPVITPLESNAPPGMEPAPAPEPPPMAPEPVAPEPETEPETEWVDFDDVPTAAQLKTPAPEAPAPPPERPMPADPQAPVRSLREEPRERVIPATSTPPSGGPPVGPPKPPPGPLNDVMDSFGDPEEAGVMQAEEARILEARRRMAEQRREAAQQAPVVRRPPPHTKGVREEAVSLDATQVGMVGDAPAFRLPTQELSARGRGGRAAPEQEPADTQSRNPHFVPPKR
jgi:hypothetical protein